MSVEIRAEIPASVMRVNVRVGDTVHAGDEMFLLESMKMEIPVLCEHEGTVVEIPINPMESVRVGDVLTVIDAISSIP